MRHPHLLARIKKGVLANPRVKLFSSKKGSKSGVQDLEERMKDLNIYHGLGMITRPVRQIRRPLKFIM